MIFSRVQRARFAAAAAAFALAMPAPAMGAGEAAEQAGVTPARIGATVFDVAVLRPLGATATVAGLAFFVASLPLSAQTLEVEESWEIFVLVPGEYTFSRPLGEF